MVYDCPLEPKGSLLLVSSPIEEALPHHVLRIGYLYGIGTAFTLLSYYYCIILMIVVVVVVVVLLLYYCKNVLRVLEILSSLSRSTNILLNRVVKIWEEGGITPTMIIMSTCSRSNRGKQGSL